MCIAILNPPNRSIKEEILRNCWENNNDGAGMLWVDNGKLKAFKEVKDYGKFYKRYKAIRNKFPESNIVLHFRISTSGKVDEHNTHPFFVNPDVAFCHNGIIKSMEISKNFSDTYMLNKIILQGLPKNFMKNKAILELLSEYIGASKLLFLNNKNEYAIVNESMGHWEDECWWSNYTYTYAYKGYSCDTSAYSQRDWWEEKRYRLGTVSASKDKAYGDEDFCGECGHPVKSEYEQRYQMCIRCMEDLREGLDEKYQFVSGVKEEIKK